MQDSDYVVLSTMTAGDVEVVAALAAECAADAWSVALFQGELESTQSQIWLLKDRRGQLLGFIVLRIVDHLAEIFNVAVSPRHRRCGHGNLLLKHAVSRAVDAGCERVWLEVRESNIAAVTLYIQSGFRTVGIRAGYYAKGKNNAVQMERILRREMPDV